MLNRHCGYRLPYWTAQIWNISTIAEGSIGSHGSKDLMVNKKTMVLAGNYSGG